MKDEMTTLTECLFTLVSSFNTALDRLDELTDRHEQLIDHNEIAFKLAREDFFRRIIEAEVSKQTHKDQKQNTRRVQFGSDIVRKSKRS